MIFYYQYVKFFVENFFAKFCFKIVAESSDYQKMYY